MRNSLQQLNVQFMGTELGTTSVELIEPLPGESPVRRALERGGGLNHLCFEVPDLGSALDQAQTQRSICILPPMPAAAFGGRKIAFLLYRGIGLIELVETPGS